MTEALRVRHQEGDPRGEGACPSERTQVSAATGAGTLREKARDGWALGGSGEWRPRRSGDEKDVPYCWETPRISGIELSDLSHKGDWG